MWRLARDWVREKIVLWRTEIRKRSRDKKERLSRLTRCPKSHPCVDTSMSTTRIVPRFFSLSFVLVTVLDNRVNFYIIDDMRRIFSTPKVNLVFHLQIRRPDQRKLSRKCIVKVAMAALRVCSLYRLSVFLRRRERIR